MAIRFVTGNKNKFSEAAAILPGLEMLELDLPEIQHSDPKEIVMAKLAAAGRTGVIVEDVSLRMDCLGGLPGPLVKWFLKAMGAGGLAALAERLGNDGAEAVATIGYRDPAGETHLFEGSVKGRIVRPRGKSDFGWDPIFLPEGGSGRTFAEMGMEEKNRISHRARALGKLREFLENGR